MYANLKLLRDTEGKAENNFFKALGFEYHYVADGHNIKKLVETFEKVKNTNHPTIIHIHTIKGKGLADADERREFYHWILPNALDNKPQPAFETYDSITADYITKKYEKDPTVVAISPATPGVTGFTRDFRAKAGKHYVDVGIAEEHAIAFSSGIAKNGGKPILGVMSSFIQRTYDQLSQDLALNSNPATLLVFWGAISGADATHLCSFDISLISNIPNLIYLSPVNKEEYLKMLDWSVEQKDYPVAIRVPFGNVISSGTEDNTDYSQINKYKIEEKGADIAIIGAGNFFELGKKVKALLSKKLGINATLINPHFLSGIDEELLNSLKSDHKLVITLEDGIVEGGFGQKISSFYGSSDMKVLNFGGKKEFTDRIPLEDLYKRYHLTPELIVEDIEKTIK